MLNNIDAAYAAGFFDGEGCVTCSIKQNGTIHSLHLSIANTNREILDWLKKTYGGSISYATPHPRKKQGHHLQICGDSAASFVKLILPYSKIKREQLIIAHLYFESRGTPNGASRSKAANQYIYDELKRLNKRGP